MTERLVRTIVSCEGTTNKSGKGVIIELRVTQRLEDHHFMEDTLQGVGAAARAAADELGISSQTIQITALSAKLSDDPPVESEPKPS